MILLVTQAEKGGFILNLSKLISFCKVVEKGSMSVAAKELDLTQPAVSKHIKALEDDLDIYLLERSNNKFKPTLAGELLYEHSNKIFAHIEEFQTGLQKLRSQPQGVLKIIASNIPGQYVLLNILNEFHKEYSRISFDLKITNSKQAVSELLKGEAKVIAIGDKVDNPDFVFNKIAMDNIYLTLPPQHQLVDRNDFSLEDILKYPWILRKKGSATRKKIEEFLIRKGINLQDLNIVGEFESSEAILDGVKSGFGITFASEYSTKNDVKLGKVIRKDRFSFKRALYLVTTKDYSDGFLVEKLLKFLQD